jgi:drug/metabolite transporter (DMT)-like permease
VKPYLALILGVCASSTAAILIRFAQQAGVSSLVIAAYRLTVATLVLSVIALQKRTWREYATLTGKEIAVILLSGVLLGAHFASWITSLAYTSVASSVVLVSTTPLWIGLASPFVLRERNSLWMWVGVLVATAGGIVIGLADSGQVGATTMWGNVLALVGAIAWAGYMMIGRRLRGRLSLLAYIWLVYGTAAVILTISAVLSGSPLAGYCPEAYVYMVLLALVPQLIGHSSVNYALRHVSASFVAVAVLGEPIGSTLLAIPLLGEEPGVGQLIGGGLVLVGVGLATREEKSGQREGAKGRQC